MPDKPKKKSEGIVSWPKTERPREKLVYSGPETLSDGELMAVLLRIGKAGQSAEDLGRHLLAKFKGINGIDRAHMEELMTVPGMGVAKTAQLKAAIEIGKRVRMQKAQPKSFDGAADAVAYIQPWFEGKRQECFLAILLDGQNHLLAERIIAEGIPTQATVYVRRVIEESLAGIGKRFYRGAQSSFRSPGHFLWKTGPLTLKATFSIRPSMKRRFVPPDFGKFAGMALRFPRKGFPHLAGIAGHALWSTHPLWLLNASSKIT